VSHRRGAGIAVFKLLKAAALIVLGVTALVIARDGDALTTLRHIVSELRFDPNNRLVNRAIGAMARLDERRLDELGVGTFVYAAVFLVEGIGLLLRKRWAEYLTVIVTASFIPFEVYEIVERPSALKGAGIGLNALIVLFLVVRLWRERHDQSR
jgi:uncharacterized membrane protein (DUF2068 family)